MSELYIGLMSGTSADGIDAALVDFSQSKLRVVATHYVPYPNSLRAQIKALFHPGDNEIYRLATLDVILGKAFASAVHDLLKQQSLERHHIKAIGSHGQTIRHLPDHPHYFTMQIGDPNVIVAETGITTVSDFRRKDVALGGQGAPLVPAFHHALFAKAGCNRTIVNIGGIANITVLPSNALDQLIAFDTGPGNTLLDAWITQHQSATHDAEGTWSRKGTLDTDLLNQLLSDAYFKRQSPKSTGFDYFNLAWLQQHLNQLGKKLSPETIQRTLTELTAQSIAQAIQDHFKEGEILLCGGGTHNQFLVERINEAVQPRFRVATTEAYGMHPDWLEAAAFAWLAKQTLQQQPGNLPQVTGAKKAVVLGGVYSL